MTVLLTKSFLDQVLSHDEVPFEQDLQDSVAMRSVWGGGSPSQSSDAAQSSFSHTDDSVSCWSESLQAVIEQPLGTLPRNLILGGVLFSTVVGAWAWFGTVEEVSFAQGKVAPQGDVYRVQPTIGGEVTRLYVKEGDQVREGQRLAEIDHELVQKEVERLTASLNAYELKLGQIRALIQQTRSEGNILRAMTQADVAARHSSLMQEQAAIATHEQLLEQYEVDRVAQAGRLHRLTELVEQGVLAEDHLFQLGQALRDRERSITETTGNIRRSEAAIAQLEAELAQTQAVAEKQLLEAQEKLQQLQIESTELTSTSKETQILLEKSKAELSQTLLIAPVDGILSSLKIANEGEVLQPGDTLAEIAPSTAPLVLAAMLPSQEAGLVETGMKVNMKFDAFPYQEYGLVEGTVLSMSPDTDISETTGAIYHVEVSLNQNSMQHEGKEIPLKAGQTATAEIIVSERRIINLVLDPIRKLKNSNISL